MELNKVADFLKVSHFRNDLPRQHSNITVLPLSPISLWVLNKHSGRDSILYKIARKLNFLFPQKKPMIPVDLIHHLESVFEPYNQQ